MQKLINPAIITLALATFLMTATTANAQVDPDLLNRPWDERTSIFEGQSQYLYMVDVDNDDADDVNIFYSFSNSRFKLETENQSPDLAGGLRLRSLHLYTTDRPDIRGAYYDWAIVGGYKFGEFTDDWSLGIIAGIGTANDNHFKNSDSYYGLGTLQFSKQLNTTDKLHLGITFDGNSDLYPDIPLPYIAYEHNDDPDLYYRIGFPYTTILWQATDLISFGMTYSFPADLLAIAGYKLNNNWSLFGEFIHSIDAFHIDGMGSTRMFYRNNRIDGGIAFVNQYFDIGVGVGYAFDQDLVTGFDIRDTTPLADLSNAAYGFIRVRTHF